MKYGRLTKEQLEEMHQEFITFLASQGIDAEQWNKLKSDKPDLAEEEIDLFSDLVWEKVLSKVNYLEHFSKQQIYLFNIGETHLSLIGVKLDNEMINLATREGLQWLRKNLMDDQITLYTSTKAIAESRNTDVYALIKQGANITKGELYEYFADIVNQD